MFNGPILIRAFLKIALRDLKQRPGDVQTFDPKQGERVIEWLLARNERQRDRLSNRDKSDE